MTSHVSVCMPLTGTAMCPDFAGFKAFVPAGAPILNVNSFDTFVSQSYGSGFIDLVRRNTQGGYGCSGWDGSGMRYMHSIICAYYVQMGFAYSVRSPVTCNGLIVPQVIPLCSSTLDAFSAAWDAVFSNPAYCPSGMPAAAQNYKAMLMASQRLASTDGNCLAGELGDGTSCGFLTSEEAIAYCSAPATESQPCCSRVAGVPPKPIVVAKAAEVSVAPSNEPSASSTLTSTSTTKSAPAANTAVGGAINAPGQAGSISPSLNQNATLPTAPPHEVPMVAITGLAVGVVVLVAVVLIVYKLRRRRASNLESPFNDGIALSGRISDTKLASSLSEKGYSSTGILSSKGSLGTVKGGAALHIREALVDFVPSQPDELAIKRRDKITIDHIYDDGWAIGFNNRTIKDGVFPVYVFEAPENDPFGKLQTKRASSIFGAVPVATPELPATLGRQHRAVCDFFPELEDEMIVRAGDAIILIKKFDDGWAMGKNMRTGQSGLFPIDCIFGNAENERRKTLRTSSLYTL
ncbi:hypothetical protein HDU78_006101 [Chytriomyces hyalinus]|nr:hypothetical protein HDU78_006101 [Chytriomyces hyalinus]